MRWNHFQDNPHDILYNTILTRIYMLDPKATTGPDMLELPVTTGLDMFKPLVNIHKVQIHIGTFGEYLLHKYRLQIADNSITTLEYMENYTPGYYWSNYVIIEDLPEISKDKLTHITQSIMAKKVQGEKGWNILLIAGIISSISFRSIINILITG